MSAVEVVDLRGDVFARRFANLLVATRTASGRSIRSLARTDRDLSVAELKAVEAGMLPLDEEFVARVAGIYGCDLGAILPARLPVTIRAGIISAGGVAAIFDPNDATSLLHAYLQLVRQLRRQRKAPAVDLRRDDVEVLAAFLQQAAESVVDRLAVLAGAARPQRLAMAGLFASGAMVIGLVGTAVAGGGPSPGVPVVASQVHDARPAILVGPGTGDTAPRSAAPTPSVESPNVPRTADGPQPMTSVAPQAIERRAVPPATLSTSLVAPPDTTRPTTLPEMIDTDLVAADVDTATPPVPSAPSVPAPDTTVPETMVPDTTVPETTVPDASIVP